MKRWKTQKYRENGCNITVYQRRIDQMQNAGCGHSRLNKIESTDKEKGEFLGFYRYLREI